MELGMILFGFFSGIGVMALGIGVMALGIGLGSYFANKL
jgi:hypothetical protein